MRREWLITTVLAIVAGLCCGRTVFAQDARREQVAAATARAVESLRQQIAAESIGHNVKVQDLLDKTEGNDALVKTLQRAQQIGGVRWIDDQTCQVQLDISGQRIETTLLDIAKTNPKKSPIPPDVLANRIKTWENRTFSAVGTSTGAAALTQVRPVDEGAAWSGVSDQARQQAVTAAKQNAVGEVVRCISPIALAGGKTVGDAMQNPDVRGGVEKWIASRPVTQVEFKDDLSVNVIQATPGDELLDVFRLAVEKSQPDLAKTMKPADWDRVRVSFANAVSTARGAAKAGNATVTRAAMNVGQAAPNWVDQQIEADGAGTPRGSRLKAARAAEADAQAKLRAKVDALPWLPSGGTIADAAKQDPKLNDAVNRAILRSRPAKVDYQPDGSARVHVLLDLREVWAEISDQP